MNNKHVGTWGLFGTILGPATLQEAPRTPQECSKSAPEGPQEVPEVFQVHSKRFPEVEALGLRACRTKPKQPS